MNPNESQTIRKFAIIMFMLIALILLAGYLVEVFGEEISDEEIVEAIYLAEGAERAVKPFGILSVACDGYDECRQICLNTVRNNRKRYADYGYKQYDTFLAFLQSRYAPTENCDNDPQGLNKYWLRNVRYFLEKAK